MSIANEDSDYLILFSLTIVASCHWIGVTDLGPPGSSKQSAPGTGAEKCSLAQPREIGFSGGWEERRKTQGACPAAIEIVKSKTSNTTILYILRNGLVAHFSVINCILCVVSAASLYPSSQPEGQMGTMSAGGSLWKCRLVAGDMEKNEATNTTNWQTCTNQGLHRWNKSSSFTSNFLISPFFRLLIYLL